MSKLILTAHHKHHLGQIGIEKDLEELDVSDIEYQHVWDSWKRSLPKASDETIHRHVIGTLAWRYHRPGAAPPVPALNRPGAEVPVPALTDINESITRPPVPCSGPIVNVDMSRVEHLLRLIGSAVPIIIVLLFALVFLSLRAHADSKIYVITVKDSSNSLLGSFAAPFTIKCNSNVSCTVGSGILTVNSTASAGSSTFQVNGSNTTSQTLLNFQDSTCTTVTNPSAGNIKVTFSCALPSNTSSIAHQFFTAYNSTTGAFTQAQPAFTDVSGTATNSQLPVVDVSHGGAGATNTGAAGKVLIGNGSGAFVEGDPLVQGLNADGSTTAENPVVVGGYDTAGTPAKHRVTMLSGTPAGTEYGVVVRNIPSGTQPVSGTVTTSPPSNASSNVAQINGVTPLMGAGNTGTGSLRVTISTDQAQLTSSLKVDPSAVTSPVSIAANVATTDAATSATGSAVPAKAGYMGGSDGTNLVGLYLDPCQRGAKTSYPVNISTATTVRFASPTASKKTYLCSIFLMAGATDNVNIIEGTGGTCGTGTAGVTGGTTAASGPNAAANGGFTLGNGLGSVAITAGTNVDTCLITSAAVQLSGVITYVQAP